jgi:hypothetical protein
MSVEHAASCSTAGSGDLAEGDACVLWGESTNGATTLELSGLLWNHKFSRVITPAGQPRTLARILTGFSVELGDAKAEIELAARAVNAQWSMIGTWGGSDGYGDELDKDLYGSYGCGCGGSNIDMIGGGGGSVSLERRGSIDDQITRATNACHVKARVEISLELTLAEIVDVAIVAADPADRACVTEAVWATPLALTKPAKHDTAKVVLVP